jgi:two-component system cell cycle response regulator
MTREQVLETVMQSDNLPTLPTVASELVRITGRADTPIGDIAALITKDIAMSAKVLKVVNSAYYNFSNQISTIQQAVSILGINAVRSLVLSFTFFKIRKAGFSDPFDYEKFWERALSSAGACS